MSRSVVGVRVQRALYLVGAFVIALSIAVVASSKAEAQPMTASWYGPGFAGQPTASGAIFDPQAMTAAHKTLPFGTELRVCYQDCTVVTVNDRGPYSGGRDLDLSAGAAQAVGLDGVGVVDVTILGQGGSAAQSAAPQQGSAPVEAAPQQAAPQQDVAPQAAAAPSAAAAPAAESVTAAPQGISNVQNSQISQQSNIDVNVFEKNPGYFVAKVVVPVGPEGYQAAYERALEIAQQRANAAASLA